MGSSRRPKENKLAESEAVRIKAEVRQAAVEHLNAKDAATALSHFTDDVIAVSNTRLFPSYEVLAEDVTDYYKILKKVNVARWEEMHIRVISTDAALVAARFRFGYTDTNDERTDLEGVWTALYVRAGGHWKIRARHESFAPIEN